MQGIAVLCQNIVISHCGGNSASHNVHCQPYSMQTCSLASAGEMHSAFMHSQGICTGQRNSLQSIILSIACSERPPEKTVTIYF